MTAYSLDHVALAVRRWHQAGPVLAGRFGGRWDSGYVQPVFCPAQVEYADGMRVELLEPGADPASFVRRYLDGRQAAALPHHITFKVRDIRVTLETARAHGFEPILVNLANAYWQEGFLHPKDTGLGFLVQVAQAAGSPKDIAGDLPGARPSPWPTPEGPRAALPVVAGRVAGWDRARTVLCDILGGVESSPAPGVSVFAWPSGAELLLTADPGAAPGLRLLAFRGDGTTSWELPEVLEAAEREPLVPELGIRVTDLAADAGAGSREGTLPTHR
jgi:hypothetical protein